MNLITVEKENAVETAEQIAEIASANKLQHIAIIMDGNRRWAKKHNFPSAMGHKRGVESLKNAVMSCQKFGIKYLTVYAFSTENWNRDKSEVDFLMDLFVKTIANELTDLCDNNVVLNFIGDLSKLSSKLQNVLQNSVEKTKNNTGVNLQIAINYGARNEIVNAVKNISYQVQKGEISIDDVSEEMISENLYTSNIPNPDLLIRTGGEMRVSNYLLWQIAYSEFFVTPTFWPEFDEQSMSDAICEFNRRQRRYGV